MRMIMLFLYNKLKTELPLSGRRFKLGYMVASSPELELFGAKVIGKNYRR
jgi:hypothetical protein